jgi:hypothetical protein
MNPIPRSGPTPQRTFFSLKLDTHFPSFSILSQHQSSPDQSNLSHVPLIWLRWHGCLFHGRILCGPLRKRRSAVRSQPRNVLGYVPVHIFWLKLWQSIFLQCEIFSACKLSEKYCIWSISGRRQSKVGGFLLTWGVSLKSVATSGRFKYITHHLSCLIMKIGQKVPNFSPLDHKIGSKMYPNQLQSSLNILFLSIPIIYPS